MRNPFRRAIKPPPHVALAVDELRRTAGDPRVEQTDDRIIITTGPVADIDHRIARWRRLMFWSRVVGWLLVAGEYVVGRLQWDEAGMFVVAALALCAGRRWPNLVVCEFFAVCYLALEEPNHFVPFALCVLLAGHVGFGSRMPYLVLAAAGVVGLGAGWMDGPYPESAVIHMALVVVVVLWGARVVRVWVEQLVSDVTAGMNGMLDQVTAAPFLDFASSAAATMDLMVGDNPVVDRLRDRVIELETANQCAQVALRTADEPLAHPASTVSTSSVRPHFLTRGHSN